jgi:hypothetical protein
VTQPIILTPEKPVEITGYQCAVEQLKWFRVLGVPAQC